MGRRKVQVLVSVRIEVVPPPSSGAIEAVDRGALDRLSLAPYADVDRPPHGPRRPASGRGRRMIAAGVVAALLVVAGALALPGLGAADSSVAVAATTSLPAHALCSSLGCEASDAAASPSPADLAACLALLDAAAGALDVDRDGLARRVAAQAGDAAVDEALMAHLAAARADLVANAGAVAGGGATGRLAAIDRAARQARDRPCSR